ncbi:MAG: LysM peptidoglycan-binding domain-containing protein [Gemmatimonadaceae bacterium]
MGIFDKKDKPDFSDVGSGSGTASSKSVPSPAGKADFSDVQSGSSSTASTGKTYTVVSGDSLSKIAKRFYGDASQWKKIHAANIDRVPNPDLIHPGQELTIPDA